MRAEVEQEWNEMEYIYVLFSIIQIYCIDFDLLLN